MGILKTRNNNERKSRKLQWDEEALEEAQKELDSLERCNPVNEPKTPFVHGVRTPSKSPERKEDQQPSYDESKTHSTWSTTSESEVESEIDKDEFEEHRKEHYHMGNALKLGRHLIETDEEEI